MVYILIIGRDNAPGIKRPVDTGWLMGDPQCCALTPGKHSCSDSTTKITCLKKIAGLGSIDLLVLINLKRGLVKEILGLTSVLMEQDVGVGHD